MKAVCGTGKQEFGSLNFMFYAFINVEALFEIIPSIDVYITGNGRIVTKCSIRASLVTKARGNDIVGTEMRDAMQAPNPPAPAGPPGIRSRDSKGGSPAPRGSYYTDLPLADRTIVTRANKELKSGHMNMLPRMSEGTPWEQHRQLQMLRGVFKKTQCNREFSNKGCEKGSDCVFAHSTDNPAAIANEVNPLRFNVYTQLYNDGFPLPPPILCEICKNTKVERDAALDSRARHIQRVNEQALNEQAARAQRPRAHDNSRSPRISITPDCDSTTPDPQRRAPQNYDGLLRTKGKGRGDGSTRMEVDAETAARPRDHTSGGADDEASDREEEAAAPIDDDNMGSNPPEDDELRSLSDHEAVPEPAQQIANESGDVCDYGRYYSYGGCLNAYARPSESYDD